MNKYEPACFYLRKSREDQEAETHGDGETLAKHKRALIKLAKDYNVNITKMFEEVVSGENIIHRPQMINLLKEVDAGYWKSVFCMDIDRLGRGGMRDQGLIIDTFKTANTLIVTPRKVYNLNDEFDEEYTEFEAFMARKELKIITRRMQSGRRRSSAEGNFLGSVPPYGYSVVKDDRRRYLVKNPEQSKYVELIFSLYRKNCGASKIANHLNNIGSYSPSGIRWTNAAVLSIIKNPTYTGVIIWGKNTAAKIVKNNAHEPYLTAGEFDLVQNILKKNSHPQYFKQIVNPLAGLIICHYCGTKMVRRPHINAPTHLRCYTTNCQNKSSKLEYVERELLNILQAWLDDYKSKVDLEDTSNKKNSTIPIKENALISYQKELIDLKKQKDNLHDLLEKGIYDSETYLERSKTIITKMNEASDNIKKIEKSLSIELKYNRAKKDIIPKIEYVINTYDHITDIEQKNKLLKSIIDHVVYKKEKTQRGRDFSLILYPRTFEQYV